MSNDAPYLRWFVGDYLGDTGHLTCVEHGAYTQILWACWKRGGSVPEKHVPRLVGMTPEEWADSRDTLAEFFEVDDGLWRHGRVGEEISHVEAKREAASAAGKKSARSRLRGKTPKPSGEAVKTASSIETSTPKSNEPAANDEQPFNARSTDVEPTPNYGDVDGDVHCSRPSDSNNDTPRDDVVSSPDPIDYLRRLTLVHGYDELRTRTAQKNIAQARQWAADRVTHVELDDAITQSRQQIGDERDPPIAYVAKVLAGNRQGGRAVASGPPVESRSDRVARIVRETEAMYGDGDIVALGGGR